MKTQDFSSSSGVATNAIIQAHPIPSTRQTMDMCDLDWSRSLPPASVTLGEFMNLSKSQFSHPGSRANGSRMACGRLVHGELISKDVSYSALFHDPEQVPYFLS